MLNINYNLLLEDSFVLGLTNNILRSHNSNKNIIKGETGFIVVENNNFIAINKDELVLKILNSIQLYKMTKEDPFAIFKMKEQGFLNDNNYDSNLYNTICISILSNENKILRQQLNMTNQQNKKRRLF